MYNNEKTFLVTCPAGKSAISIPETVASIGTTALYWCSKLTSVTLPDSVQYIGGNAFWGCDSLSTIVCKAATPPSAEVTTFSDATYAAAALTVPTGSDEAYKAHGVWKRFEKFNDKIQHDSIFTYCMVFPDPTDVTSLRGLTAPTYRYHGGTLTVSGGIWSLYTTDGTLLLKSSEPTANGVRPGLYILVTQQGRVKVVLR